MPPVRPLAGIDHTIEFFQRELIGVDSEDTGILPDEPSDFFSSESIRASSSGSDRMTFSCFSVRKFRATANSRDSESPG